MGTHPIFESDFDCLTVEMRTLLVLVIEFVLSVDRGNFKTCKDSSFCERRRKFDGEGEKYRVTENYLDQNVLTLKLEAEGKPCLKALHSILEGKSARILVEECEPLLPRYQVANELIVEGYDASPVQLETDASFIKIQTKDGQYLKTSITDYYRVRHE